MTNLQLSKWYMILWNILNKTTTSTRSAVRWSLRACLVVLFVCVRRSGVALFYMRLLCASEWDSMSIGRTPSAHSIYVCVCIIDNSQVVIELSWVRCDETDTVHEPDSASNCFKFYQVLIAISMPTVKDGYGNPRTLWSARCSDADGIFAESNLKKGKVMSLYI